MPISSSAAAIDKKRVLKVKNKSLTPNSEQPRRELLSIGSTFSSNVRRGLQRAHSTLSVVDVKPGNAISDPVALESNPDGSVRVSRTQKEKERNPDRICLDRRGLTVVPVIEGETRLRLLSMQHNLVNTLEQLKYQAFPFLVFLDVYDNQMDRITNLGVLENLRVLLLGKNRIKKIEGLESLKKLEVLDLHGNQIGQVGGLAELAELKVLNLAGNLIKNIGPTDLCGLFSLQELNLRRNRLRKLSGFGDTPNLEKLFVSNNEIQTVEEMSSIAKCSNVRELSIENNPVSAAGDCASFLISYLPKLTVLNNMQVTEQVRKAAMGWRRNKECTNATYKDLSCDITLNVRRDEVISNARTNWELIRTQTKCLSVGASNVGKASHLNPETDIILTSLGKRECKSSAPIKAKGLAKTALLPDKKLNVTRTNSQDTENSQHTSSSNLSAEFFKLPPILVPIVSKLENKVDGKEGSVKDSLCSIGPNIDSSVSSILTSHSDSDESSSSESSESDKKDFAEKINDVLTARRISETAAPIIDVQAPEIVTGSGNNTETSSNLSTNTTLTTSSNNESDPSRSRCSIKSRRSIKSATNQRSVHSKVVNRAATAKPKKHSSPKNEELAFVREREQGGDYLIEICGRHLNVYGQGALRFIDKSWCSTKAQDVNTVNFNYANFNHISNVLCKVKPKFPNADHFIFKETNIYCLGQLNALAEIQGLVSLTIGKEGNPIYEKHWEPYAVYRLSHWGLKTINGKEINEKDVEFANEEYQSLSDLVLWSLPDPLLQPLLARLRIDVNNTDGDLNPKKWLMSADPALRSVVSKEALQWKKAASMQEDLMMRQRARGYMTKLLQEMCNTVNKLRLFEERWPNILREIVRNTLLDYSQLDMYMKRKLQDLK